MGGSSDPMLRHGEPEPYAQAADPVGDVRRDHDSQQVQRAYARLSKVYDQAFGPILHDGRVRAIRRMRLGPGDAVLDVLIFKGPKSDSFTMLPKIYRGEHLPHDHVQEFRVKRRLVIDADRPLPIEADGEVLGTTPATVDVLAQPIQMKL